MRFASIVCDLILLITACMGAVMGQNLKAIAVRN